jgi:hypothetical protein
MFVMCPGKPLLSNSPHTKRYFQTEFSAWMQVSQVRMPIFRKTPNENSHHIHFVSCSNNVSYDWHNGCYDWHFQRILNCRLQ